MTSRKAFRAAALAALAVLAVGAAGADAPEESAKPNVLLICVNTLNRSHLGVSGRGASVTPNIDRFAANAFVFTNLVAPATYTSPVISELLNARFDHDGQRPDKGQFQKLSDTMVARWLESQGYEVIQTFNEDLADLPESLQREPFFRFVHPLYVHIPYDRFLRGARLFQGADAARYDAALRTVTHFELYPGVRKPVDELCTSGFGHDPNLLPEFYPPLWSAFARDAREPARGAAHDLLKWAMTRSAFEALRRPGRPEELAPEEKRAIVKALNRLVDSSDTPLKKLVLASAANRDATVPGTGEGMRNVHYAVRRFLKESPVVNGSLRRPRNRAERVRLKLLYAETLDAVFPAMKVGPPPGWKYPLQALQNESRAVGQESQQAEQTTRMLVALYDAALNEWDALFGTVLDGLRRRGLSDRTVIVLMGDHGEAFGEHGQFNHASVDCYDELINPPLLVRIPARAGRRTDVAAQLRTVDVLPTLFDLAGLPPADDDGPLDGVSIARAVNGERVPITAFSRNDLNTWSIRKPDGWKLIWKRADDRKMLFNLNEDPGETRDVSAEFPDRRAALEQELERHVYEVSPADSPPGAR